MAGAIDPAGVVPMLEELAYYEGKTDTFRGKAFKEAADTIKVAVSQGLVIRSGKDVGYLKGVGKSTVAAVDEYMRTGRVQRLENLKPADEKINAIKLFKTVYGVGDVNAEAFYIRGYRTLHDLWYKADLTEGQKIGIMWRLHLEIKIPRAEMTIINTHIKRVLGNITWEMAGSYRREEPTSGDVDLLILEEPGVTLERVVNLLRPWLPATLAHGEHKYMGIFRLSDQHVGHRIDIRMASKEAWPYSLMYFTGSGRFNILMRERAISLGLKLSEYDITVTDMTKAQGVYGPNFRTVPLLTSEAQIFQLLGVPYKEPRDRKKMLVSL